MTNVSQPALLMMMGTFDILLGLGLAWWGTHDDLAGLQWAGLALALAGVVVVGFALVRSSREERR
ncbi:hypothetical protein [Nocardioides daejeonensis]|uniref:hypothetical protein n=1 Tax=Nocardioides daejeonensis TaxID=1046556 RepID=UPI000D749772|nr:hypothetical protein [Nocardioides daejeonensis]